MEKTVILPEQAAVILERLCASEHLPDGELVRLALEAYAHKRRQATWRALFGAWKNRLKVDAVDYADRVREGGDIDEMFYDEAAMRQRREASMRKIFGLWKDRPMTEQTYIDDMRDEWEAHLQELHAPNPPDRAH